MRNEREMFDLILNRAKTDARIRGVYLNGSRTNPDAPRDLFQDYDIVYLVTETESFLVSPDWINCFGTALMIQEPDKLDAMCGKKVCPERSYGYLMLFEDGNRIDLHIQTIEGLEEEVFFHEPARILMDKDGILENRKKKPGTCYQIGKPSEGEYMSCCNDFWWCMQNVGKGLWRDEFPYARKMYEDVVRGQLDRMLAWWIAGRHGAQVVLGKMGKYMQRYLPEEYWKLYQNTCRDACCKELWDAVECMCGLFEKVSREAAEEYGFLFCEQDPAQMRRYLRAVKNLPADAKAFHSI